MRSARHVLALTGGGGRRGTLLSCSLLLQPRAWRSLSSAAAKPPPNPFEIDLNVLKEPASTIEKLTLDDATRAAASQQAEAQHEIDLLHGEMSKLFGEEVAEYGGDTSSSSVEKAVGVFDKRTRTREQEGVLKERKDAVLQPPVTRAARKPNMVEKISRPMQLRAGNLDWQELHRQIQALADDLKIVVKDRDYCSEKIILQTLLEAREDQVIVLCWNISLSKSPFVVHALELIQSRVIIVSPSNVEHGPLPANVVGVLSGFWNQSISLALSAAANLLQLGVQNTKQHELSNGKKIQNAAGIASSKKGVSTTKAKKKFLTCYLCGKEGHIRSKCPELPRNNV
ncbi:hypothetical protein PC116_g6380 [Phytophthora cactorum]|nr:hypothetical protein PC116_g6380 [Phytophthora cactorum]